MTLNKNYGSISIISAAVAIIVFCMLLLMAILAYPGAFSPLTNNLSDLGNSRLNPQGAILFNLACGIAGALTAVFFAGLGEWRLDGQIKLTVARLIGMFAGLTLILVGIFSEDSGSLHMMVSGIFFISLTAAIIATSIALWKHPAHIRLIIYYGLLVGISSLIYTLSYLADQIIILEWITVAGSLLWMGLLAYNMLRLAHTSTASFKKE